MDLIGDRTVRDLLEEKVALCPERTFLVVERREGSVETCTYREFNSLVDRVANGLLDSGIVPGEKVVVHLPNGVPALATWFALAKIGAVAVPSNTAHTGRELEHVLVFSDAVALVTDPQFVETFQAILPNAPAVRLVFVTGALGPPRGAHPWKDLWERSSASLSPTYVRGESLLEILFTSGTTARPKGALVTHANCLWAGERASKQVRQSPDERSLTAFPWFHANAQVNSILPALTVGGTLVLLEAYSATRFWGQVRRHLANLLSLSPMLLRTILAQPAAPSDREHAVRVVMYSINCTDAEKTAFEERFGVELLNGYGLTEAMGNAVRAPLDGPRKWPSVGLPTLERQVRVVDEAGREVRRGQVGELIVKGVPGRTIVQGYYKDPRATAETIRDGWLFTGDHVRMDEAGYLYFVDRKKDVIKRAGENVSASEVELVLLEHPGVLECAVIGVPDAVRDEAVKAVVVPRPGVTLTAEDVIAHCQRRLAKFKCPGEVEFVERELPKTVVGKVDKKALRRLGGAEDTAPRPLG